MKYLHVEKPHTVSERAVMAVCCVCGNEYVEPDAESVDMDGTCSFECRQELADAAQPEAKAS